MSNANIKFEEAEVLYNIVHEGVTLNKTPLSLAKAQEEVNLIIINYGYRPQIIPA
jgi:hypothetical protein